MIVGNDNEGLRLTRDIENSRLVVTVTHGPDPSCSNWIGLYDMVIADTDKLPIDHDVTIADAIDHGFELMAPKLASNTPESRGG